jgi:hypothetical protein
MAGILKLGILIGACILLVVIVAGILFFVSPPPAPRQMPPDVTMTVPFPPVPFSSDTVTNLGYELEISPVAEPGLRIIRAEVLDPSTGVILLTLEGDTLRQFYHPASIPLPTAQERQAGTQNLTAPRLSLWVRIAPAKVPETLVQRLTFDGNATAGAPLIITGGKTRILSDQKPAVIGPPLMGNGWIAMETTTGLSHHFLTQYTQNNATTVPLRFAVDLLLIDPSTRSLVSGNWRNNSNWYGYGKEIIAVGDGTVTEVKDTIPDNPEAGVISSGQDNYVILDLGNSTYADYRHMMPGSIRVKVGDRVKTGAVLGRVGNSGGSLAPHLHFQISNGPNLWSEGIPFVYRSFEVMGECPAGACVQQLNLNGFSALQYFPDILTQYYTNGTCTGRSCTYFPQPVHHENEDVEDSAIVRFGGL